MILPERYTASLKRNRFTASSLYTKRLIYYCRKEDESVTKKEYKAVYDIICRLIATISGGENRMELRGLGSFYPSFRKERTLLKGIANRVPVVVPEHFAVLYKPSKSLLKAMNKESSTDALNSF